MKIKDLPPKLQALAIQRTRETMKIIGLSEIQMLNLELGEAFYWRDTMEELSFNGYWSEVNRGIGIEEKESAL